VSLAEVLYDEEKIDELDVIIKHLLETGVGMEEGEDEAEEEEEEEEEEEGVLEMESDQKIETKNGYLKLNPFNERNTSFGLEIVYENTKKEKEVSQNLTEFEKACVWLHRLCTLNGVGEKFINEILSNPQQLQILFNQKKRKIDQTVNSKTFDRSFLVHLPSRKKITYLPITYSYQKSEMLPNIINDKKKMKLDKETEIPKIFANQIDKSDLLVLFWDPMQTFRSKGTSTGPIFFFLYFYFLFLFIFFLFFFFFFCNLFFLLFRWTILREAFQRK